MAGTTNPSTSSKQSRNLEVDDVALSWVYDYIEYRIWKKFDNQISIEEADIDVIQGLNGLLGNKDVYLDKELAKHKCLFMVNICRLDDGEDISIRYEETSDETPLECLLTSYEDFVNLQSTELKEEGLKLISDIKSEAVLVCCRAGDFDQAKVVFDKLWANMKLDHEEKQIRKNLKIIVDGKNSEDENMTSYKTFLETMRKYLRKIFKKFPKPILLEAAENRLNSIKKISDTAQEARLGTKRRKSDRSIRASTINSIKEQESTDSEMEGNSGVKLRKLWSQNLNQLFEPSEPIEIEKTGQMLPPAPGPVPRKTPQKSQSTPTKQRSTLTQNKADSTSSTVEHPSTSTSQQETVRNEMMHRKNIDRPNGPDPTTTKQTKKQKQDSWENLSMMSASKRNKWGDGEMEEFFHAVKMFGVGNWSKIRDYLDTERTNVMLKDKWRNMMKSGDAKRLWDDAQKK